MRRIYLLGGVILCLFFMYVGNRLGSYVPEAKEIAIKYLAKKNLELERDQKLSEERSRQWHVKYQKDSARVKALEAQLAPLDRKITAMVASNKKEVAVVERYTRVQRDSFFYARYRGQDTITNVDEQKLTADLVRVHGLDTLNKALFEKIDKLEEIGFVKDTVINDLINQVTEAEFKTEILNEKLDMSSDRETLYRGEAKKYKRQRNWVCAGVGAAVIGGIVKGVSSILKR